MVQMMTAYVANSPSVRLGWAFKATVPLLQGPVITAARATSVQLALAPARVRMDGQIPRHGVRIQMQIMPTGALALTA